MKVLHNLSQPVGLVKDSLCQALLPLHIHHTEPDGLFEHLLLLNITLCPCHKNKQYVKSLARCVAVISGPAGPSDFILALQVKTSNSQ